VDGAVSAPVLNEPVVPEPPPAGEVHELLLVDDQVMMVLVLFTIEVDAAERDTDGTVEMTGAVPVLSAGVMLELPTDPPPHAASTRLNKIIVDNPLVNRKFGDFMNTPYLINYINSDIHQQSQKKFSI